MFHPGAFGFSMPGGCGVMASIDAVEDAQVRSSASTTSQKPWAFHLWSVSVWRAKHAVLADGPLLRQRSG